ncbi:hypothetical protein LTR53_004259 [Teratosphaeriaceae sp. CCFEE 6253]|nr:hypothetical protein LTR53_004259 [Teratosphaeriaceae sp. CCFEE 6253]
MSEGEAVDGRDCSGEIPQPFVPLQATFQGSDASFALQPERDALPSHTRLRILRARRPYETIPTTDTTATTSLHFSLLRPTPPGGDLPTQAPSPPASPALQIQPFRLVAGVDPPSRDDLHYTTTSAWSEAGGPAQAVRTVMNRESAAGINTCPTATGIGGATAWRTPEKR